MLKHIRGLLEERTVGALVVGLPVTPSGGVGSRATETLTFCSALRTEFPGVLVIPFDETLTSKEADTQLIEAGHTGQDRKSRRDSWAAAVILESWLRAGEPQT